MSTENKRGKTLTHSEFYQLVECLKTNRDGTALCYSWREAKEFITGKLKQEGHIIPVSEHSTEEACKIVGVELSKRKQSPKRSQEEVRDIMDILIRAVARLYEKANEPMTPGLTRLVAISRRETVIGNGKDRLPKE